MSNLKLLELEIVEKNEIIEDITKPYFNSKMLLPTKEELESRILMIDTEKAIVNE